MYSKFTMYLTWRAIVLTTFLLLRTAESTFNVETKEVAQLIEDGRNQYNLLEERSTMPQYGECWKMSVLYLHRGCKMLSESTQSEIALKFTDCFLKMSGHEPYECDKSSSKDCIKNMSDRAFNAYTEFYTQTYNICFFLQNQMWHEETEKVIEKLSVSSAHVSKQLEQAETTQSILLQQQKESISIQQDLLNNGLSLNEIIRSSQDNIFAVMHEFRTSTLEQRRILFEVFDRLSSLQAWAVGEISWLDTVVFYVGSVIVSYVVTATPKTHEARIWIFIIITLNALIERMVVSQLLKDGREHIEVFNENLYWWIWQCRKVMVAICAVGIGVAIYKYCDYNVVNHRLLLEIQKQNKEVLEFLGNLNSVGNSQDLKVLAVGNEISRRSPTPSLNHVKSTELVSTLSGFEVRSNSVSESPSLVVDVNTAAENSYTIHVERSRPPSKRITYQTPSPRYSLRSMRTTAESL